jgi:DNA-binding transcriptional LysR family regulator
MDFRHLRYFRVLAEELNFGRAAEALHITQPPLSRQIQQLEQEIGVPLFKRTPKGVELTEAGRQFREEAARVLAMAERAAQRARMAAEGRLGRLDVGVIGSAILNIIPRMVLSFRSLYPEVTVDLHYINKVEQIQALREGRLTVAFHRLSQPTPGISIETVIREPCVVAVHRSHALSKQREITLEDLADQPMILFPSRPRPSVADQIMAMFHAAGIRPKVVQEVGDTITAAAFVSSGFGLCVMPESASSLTLPQVVFRPLTQPHPTIDLDCLYLTDSDSPILSAFLEIVRSFRNERDLPPTTLR